MYTQIYDDNKCETCGIKKKSFECCLEYAIAIGDLIIYKCSCFNTNYQKKFDKILKKRLANTCKFSKHDINKLILLLWKGVYSCQYLNDCEKYNKASLPEKEDFYSHLYLEDKTLPMQITSTQKEFAKILK